MTILATHFEKVPEFKSARLKIKRAKEHIDDLNTQIGDIPVTRLYTISIDANSQTGNDVLVIELAQSLPILEDIALIIGDVFHNLESAMDYAVNEVVFRRFEFYGDHTKFPFRRTRDELVSAIDGALIHEASEAVRNFIVDDVKPYQGGNDALWAFNTMNNLDKHRLLTPVLQINLISGIRAENNRGDIHISSKAMYPGERVVRQDLNGRNYKITDNGTPSVLILFDEGSVWERKPILPTLHQFTEVVSGIVEGIERVFFEEISVTGHRPEISHED